MKTGTQLLKNCITQTKLDLEKQYGTLMPSCLLIDAYSETLGCFRNILRHYELETSSKNFLVTRAKWHQEFSSSLESWFQTLKLKAQNLIIRLQLNSETSENFETRG